MNMRTAMGRAGRLGLILLASATQAAGQQPSSCRSADSVSAIVIATVLRHTSAISGPEKDARDSLQLSPASAGQVTLVTTRSVCDKAKTAYQNALPVAPSGFSGRVYVVAAGSRYVVLDPDYNYANSGIWNFVVFDNKWKKLSIF